MSLKRLPHQNAHPCSVKPAYTAYRQPGLLGSSPCSHDYLHSLGRGSVSLGTFSASRAWYIVWASPPRRKECFVSHLWYESHIRQEDSCSRVTGPLPVKPCRGLCLQSFTKTKLWTGRRKYKVSPLVPDGGIVSGCYGTCRKQGLTGGNGSLGSRSPHFLPRLSASHLLVRHSKSDHRFPAPCLLLHCAGQVRGFAFFSWSFYRGAQFSCFLLLVVETLMRGTGDQDQSRTVS